MHKHKIIALIGAGVIGVVAAAWLLQFEGTTQAIIERFPDVPPDVVRKVHKEMLKESFSGKYTSVDVNNDDVMDQIFMLKANRLMK